MSHARRHGRRASARRARSALRPSVAISATATRMPCASSRSLTSDADRALGRDTGIDDGKAPGALADEAAEKLAQHGDEGLGLEMLAAGIVPEGRVVAEGQDRRQQHRQRAADAFEQGARDAEIGVQRQMMAMLLGDRADADDDHGVAVEPGLGLEPGQILQERAAQWTGHARSPSARASDRENRAPPATRGPARRGRGNDPRPG